MSERLRPTERLRRGAEYKLVFRRGRCFRTSHLRIHYRASTRELSRLGLVVTKRLGNAVVRSRLKRVLREIYRRQKPSAASTYDIVLVAQREPASYERYADAYARFIAELSTTEANRKDA